MNPWIRYRPPNSTQLIDGVAINLKAFTGKLDENSIPHCSEKAIRKQLRKHSLAQTHSHHRFLPAQYPTTPDVSAVSKKDLTTQYGCVNIPRADVPIQFTKYLMEQGWKVLALAVYM